LTRRSILTRGSIFRRKRHGQASFGGDWQARFVSTLADSGLALLTVLAYRHHVKLFLKWLEATKGTKTGLADLTTADVLSYPVSTWWMSPARVPPRSTSAWTRSAGFAGGRSARDSSSRIQLRR
jgi:hypothetical protein